MRRAWVSGAGLGWRGVACGLGGATDPIGEHRKAPVLVTKDLAVEVLPRREQQAVELVLKMREPHLKLCIYEMNKY